LEREKGKWHGTAQRAQQDPSKGAKKKGELPQSPERGSSFIWWRKGSLQSLQICPGKREGKKGYVPLMLASTKDRERWMPPKGRIDRRDHFCGSCHRLCMSERGRRDGEKGEYANCRSWNGKKREGGGAFPLLQGKKAEKSEFSGSQRRVKKKKHSFECIPIVEKREKEREKRSISAMAAGKAVTSCLAERGKKEARQFK